MLKAAVLRKARVKICGVAGVALTIPVPAEGFLADLSLATALRATVRKSRRHVFAAARTSAPALRGPIACLHAVQNKAMRLI